MPKILVTGGAGFIGSHTVAELLRRGWKVTVFDNFTDQVHQGWSIRASTVPSDLQYLRGDMRNQDQLKKAVCDAQVILHLAAEVGVGQSMYRIRDYIDTNVLGTGTLLDILVNERHHVEKLVVASSMSIYGEGAYECNRCGKVHPGMRPLRLLQKRCWDPRCPGCGQALQPIPTDEATPSSSTSVYALTKRDTEDFALCVGRSYGLPTVALRYFNVYGPGQALSNPYTGVAAIFCARILNQLPPLIFEDGLQSRDFIHVSDIVAANLAAIERDEANFDSFNIGTGRPLTVLSLAQTLGERLGFQGYPQVTNQYRTGDIRHCYADITKANSKLGFTPRIAFEAGVDDLIAWVRTQTPHNRLDEAVSELRRQGLIKG